MRRDQECRKTPAVRRLTTSPRPIQSLIMADDQFPSGPWRGYYTYDDPKRHPMDLVMEFGNGRITGDGTDIIGAFIIDGRYEANGECRWTKSYVARHDVFYAGSRQGKGIAGTWELDPLRGGFRVWPLGSGAGDDDSVGEETTEPVEAVGVLVE